MDLVSFLIISFVVGAIAGRHLYDVTVNIFIGIIGGLFGGYWLGALNQTGNRPWNEVFASVLGAVVFLALAHASGRAFKWSSHRGR